MQYSVELGVLEENLIPNRYAGVEGGGASVTLRMNVDAILCWYSKSIGSVYFAAQTCVHVNSYTETKITEQEEISH